MLQFIGVTNWPKLWDRNATWRKTKLEGDAQGVVGGDYATMRRMVYGQLAHKDDTLQVFAGRPAPTIWSENMYYNFHLYHIILLADSQTCFR